MVEPEITSEGLKFIRNEILKLMVSSIATAKAETLGAIEASNLAVGLLNAGSNHGAICLTCAVVVSLGERGLLDPKDVTRWATWMAGNMPAAIDPTVSETAARMLLNFTKIMESLIAARPEGPASRN